jgi:hypothetical protein
MDLYVSKLSASRLSIAAALRTIKSDERGSSIPIYAGGFLLLITASAGALSINHHSNVVTQVQAATDSAALAATNAYADMKINQAINNLSDEQIKAKALTAAKSVFKINAESIGMELARCADIYEQLSGGCRFYEGICHR